jgi:hypothetical protein
VRLESLHRVVGWIFGAFALLAGVDLVLVVVSEEYRNLLGQTAGWSSAAVRAIPDVLLIAFYLGYFSADDPVLRSRLAKIHCIVFGLVGTAMLIPWVGMFFAACSPIAVLFFGPFLLSSTSVWISYSAAATFLALNASLLFALSRSGPAAPEN